MRIFLIFQLESSISGYIRNFFHLSFFSLLGFTIGSGPDNATSYYSHQQYNNIKLSFLFIEKRKAFVSMGKLPSIGNLNHNYFILQKRIQDYPDIYDEALSHTAQKSLRQNFVNLYQKTFIWNSYGQLLLHCLFYLFLLTQLF